MLKGEIELAGIGKPMQMGNELSDIGEEYSVYQAAPTGMLSSTMRDSTA